MKKISHGLDIPDPHYHSRSSRCSLRKLLEMHWYWVLKRGGLEWKRFFLVTNASLGGGFNSFYFDPYLGKIPILTNILGWVKPPTRCPSKLVGKTSFFLQFGGYILLRFPVSGVSYESSKGIKFGTGYSFKNHSQAIWYDPAKKRCDRAGKFSGLVWFFGGLHADAFPSKLEISPIWGLMHDWGSGRSRCSKNGRSQPYSTRHFARN